MTQEIGVLEVLWVLLDRYTNSAKHWLCVFVSITVLLRDAATGFAKEAYKRTMVGLFVTASLIILVSRFFPDHGEVIEWCTAIVFPGILVGVWFPRLRSRAATLMESYPVSPGNFICLLVGLASLKVSLGIGAISSQFILALSRDIDPHMLWTVLGFLVFSILPRTWLQPRAWVATLTAVSAFLLCLSLINLLIIRSASF